MDEDVEGLEALDRLALVGGVEVDDGGLLGVAQQQREAGEDARAQAGARARADPDRVHADEGAVRGGELVVVDEVGARHADEGVGARLPEEVFDPPVADQDVRARPALEPVVPAAADEALVAVEAQEHVVERAALDGLDLAKAVLQVHGAAADGWPPFRRQLSQRQFK